MLDDLEYFIFVCDDAEVNRREAARNLLLAERPWRAELGGVHGGERELNSAPNRIVAYQRVMAVKQLTILLPHAVFELGIDWAYQYDI